MEERFIKVEDKASGRWLIIYVSSLGDHEIYASSKSKFFAQDIVLALNAWLDIQRGSEE